ncbi:phosphoribosyl 1,2-cyclic phosphate phosphodiesterase [Sphingomicrobium lutaoense]|uniref:Phosphoribosyl 1,2-cyclic phosphate phosphodiesterase n=1 Tax=Sphingomicrobium lutaoense TaxID=515949 RepID=A0A839Z152_9SPHN|nr:phosphoribosyl 1,2-cyclic phosphate phosphodiesterase [Sphingomicrobium lutaoense]
MIDCGPDLREQLLTAGIDHVDATLVTHDHADHCHGIDDLRQIVRRNGKRMALWARGETIARLRQRFAYAFEGHRYYEALLDPVPLDTDEGDWGAGKLRFVDQPHGGITSLGIRCDEGAGSIAYAIDFSDLTDDMASLYEGVDVWICDCLGRKPHPTHAHLDAVLGWARELRVGQLWLTHLDIVMDHAHLMKELPDWAAPAHDGLEIEV